MNFIRNKYVRFKNVSSHGSTPERKFSLEVDLYNTRTPFMTVLWNNIRFFLEDTFDRVKNLGKSNCPYPPRAYGHEFKKNPTQKTILDPQDTYLQNWNKTFVACCVLAVSLDPLFFYIPVIDRGRNCLDLDKKLEIFACILRTCVDLFYVIHIVLQFRTGFIAPSSRVFGRGELVGDLSVIAKRYLQSYFVIDVLSVLPIPQLVLLIAPQLSGPIPFFTKEALKYTIFIQYVPRFIRIYPLYKEMTRTSGIFAERAWTGAAFNLILYMLASHVLGAFWYLFSIERKDNCWRRETKRLNHKYVELYCGKDKAIVNTFLNDSCPLIPMEQIYNSTVFNFGIFLDALQSDVVQTRNFPKKFFYCFWWGLRNLSSLGQNLKTSTFIGENIFAIFIAIFGLLLFALLIGNMQTYLQSTTVRVEEMRVKRRDAEQWMSHRMLPEHLRERVRRYEQYKWQETRGVEEDQLIQCLPKDLRRDIKRHLCLDLLMRVPMFEKMDERLIDAMCDCLRPVLYTEKSYVLREGDPVDEMIFLMRGTSMTMSTNGGKTGFFNSFFLKTGDFCGEELFTWALDPNSSSNLPTSTRTVQAITEVEAFGLKADDLKFVASQFKRLHSKQLRHTFKYYSPHWRTWAASFIQVVWRHHCKRKLSKSLHEEEEKLQEALGKANGTSTSLGATLYASKFAASALKALRRNGFPKRVLPLLPTKPVEPDFAPKDDHL